MATRYVALLRGINVGGKNVIAMADLKACLDDAGYRDVRTYIASGNVLLTADGPRKAVEADVERVLEKRFGVPLVVVLRSKTQLRSVVAKAPKGFGTRPGTYHSDVVFLREPLTPAKALQATDPRDGVDEVWAGPGVIYFQRLSAQLTKSRLSKVASTREYKLMTIRTWTTVTKLLALLDAD